MGARLRNPGVIALVVALLPAVSLAVWLGPVRALTSHRGVPMMAAVTASPLPTPAPTPRPTPLPVLPVADRLDVFAPRAYGRIDVRASVPLESAGVEMDFPVAGYSLDTTPPHFPTSLPVWKLRGFSSANTMGLARMLGLPTTGTPIPGDDVDVARGEVRDTNTHLPASTAPTAEQAVAAATEVLRQLGVSPFNAHQPITHAFGDAPYREWQVSFLRDPLAGVQVGLDPDAQASLMVEETGYVSSVEIHEQAVDGGSMYPLRDWHEAWSDIMHRNWTVLCCLGPHGNPTTTTTAPGDSGYRLRVSKVYLYYEESDTDPDLLVPFYAFQDSRYGIEFAAPALRNADVHVVH